jgi:hypothetical protein
LILLIACKSVLRLGDIPSLNQNVFPSSHIPQRGLHMQELPHNSSPQLLVDQARYASILLDSENISEITEKEKQITGQVNPVKGGPTVPAQKHVSEQLNGSIIADITTGEKKITGQAEPMKDVPTAAA